MDIKFHVWNFMYGPIVNDTILKNFISNCALALYGKHLIFAY